MEVGKGQHQESFSRSFQHNSCDDEDDDDGHFVIALDESDQENDELDGGTNTHALTENNADGGARRGSCDFENNGQSLTNDLFENIVSGINSHEPNVSAQDSVESPSLSLHLECTRDEDEQCKFDQSPTPETSDGNDHTNVTLKVPNFLISSPEIIKRLKSTLMERSTVSQDKHNNSPSSFCETESQENTQGTKKIDAARKLSFTPRDDCACIMCHAWNPSKFVKTNEPINVTSSLELPDYSAIFSKNVSSARNISVCNASKSNVVSFATHKQTHSTHSHQSSLSNSNSGCAVGKPKVQHRKHQSSISPLMTNESGGSSSKSLSKAASMDLLLYRNVIVKQHGSYFVLFPQQLLSQRHGQTILQKKIPELDTKEGKTLILTRDFVTLYQPDLKAILLKSKKADFSNPGTVCIVMSNDEGSIQSSGTYILVSPNYSLPGCNKPTTLHQINVTDTLVKMIESHFISNDYTTASTMGKALMASQLEKHPPVSRVMDMPGSSASLNSFHSNLNAPTLSRTVRESNTFVASKVSDGPQQSSTSMLPPPPPLVRCPGFPVASPKIYSVLATRTSNSTISTCTASTTASFSSLINIASDSVGHAIVPISKHVYEEPSLTLSNDTVTSVSHCARGHTPHVPMPDSPFLIDAHTDHREVEEPREILVIPVANKHKSTEKQNDAVAVDKSLAFANPAPAPLDSPQVKSSSSLQNVMEHSTDSISHSESVGSVSQTSCNQSSISAVATTLSSVNRIPSSIVYTTSLSNIPQYTPDVVPFKPSEVKCENTASQLPSMEAFPSVVKVNLSSCASFTYASPTLSVSHCPAVSTHASYSMLPAATTSSNISSNCDSKVVTCSKSVLSSSPLEPSLLTQNPSSQSFQMHKPAILSTSSAFRSRRKQSFCGITSSDDDFVIMSPKPLSDGSANKTLLSDCEKDFSSCSNPRHMSCSTTVCSSTIVSTASPSSSIFSSAAPTSLASPTSISVPLPATSSVFTSRASVTSSISATSTSTSSVSVNGLKLKIRLGDAKNAYSVGEKKSDKSLNNANASQIKRNVSCDQIESVKGKTSSSRIETAEEMFQRFQEQAMREVYNAQFGVGNVSRSLRPSRSNISFVDRNIPLFRLDDGKKKTPEDNSGTNKATEDSKKNRCTNESLLKAPEHDCMSPKSNKKRHFSSDSHPEFPTEEPQFDINDFPKLGEDNSILVKKTIFTPNIMAGHQVFVKFNVFSNPQSGRSFLIPFFNLGGSRVQFDVEDMEYIKRSVIDVEKGEKFCARHLIYDSRVGKKASFLRKEHLTQTSDVSEKSYRSCSYILEGFSREPAKKVIPVPDEWKVDKKVSIEIDTADVDSTVVIDFEDSLADATVKKDSGKCSSQVTSALKKKVNSDSHNVVGPPVTDDTRAGTKATSKVCSYDMQGQSCFNTKEANGAINKNAHIVDLGRKPIIPTANTHSPFNGEICNDNPAQDAKSSSTSSSLSKLTMINTSSVSAANYTDQLQELLSSGASPTSSDRTLKSTKQDSSSGSAISYTDQLKELFSSGNLHDTIPSTGISGHLGEVNQEIDSDEWFVSQIVPCTPIKQEIIDEEYMPSSVPSSQTYEDSVLSDTRDSSALPATNLRIKPEPIDTDFDSAEKSRVEFPSPNMPNGNQICSSTSELHDLIDSTVGTEDDGRYLDECIKESNTNTSEKCNTDEDTVSAYSSSPLSSSSVSESSEISSSSCVDTSDENSGDDLEDDNALSATDVSFIGTLPELSGLLNENLPQNPNNTKITSLVESLKQRLSKNSPAAIPPIFNEPLKQPKLKVKRQKGALKRKRPSHRSLPFKNSTVTSYDDQRTEPMDNDEKYVSENSSLVSHSPVASTFISRTSESILDCSSSKRSDFSAITKPEQTDAIGVHGDLIAFRKRFPFITSTENVDANNLKDSDKMQTQVLASAPGDQKPGDCSDQGIEARNNLEKDVDLLACKHSMATKLPSLSSESNGIIESAPNNDNHFDSDSDIDVGTEDVTHDNVDLNASQGTEFLSTSPLSIFGRSHLRYSTKSNEYAMPKNKHDDKWEDGIDGNVPSKRFTLPIRPRNKTRAFKPKPPSPKVTAPPSTASLLCQKLDISIESITPKLKGKLDAPGASDMKVQGDKFDSVTSSDHVPKPINPGFKPSINAIFGVPDIPKSLETIINKSSSSKRAVAKKSSVKNNFQIHRQVAKKRTMGNVLRGSENVKVQKKDKTCESKTRVNHVSVPSVDNSQILTDLNVKIIDVKLQRPEIMTQLDSKSLSPGKNAKNQSKKKEIQKEIAQRLKQSTAIKQDAKQGFSQRKANLETDSNIKSTHENLKNKSKSGDGSKEVPNKGKSGIGSKEVNNKGKSGVANKKQLNSKSKLVAAKKTMSSKSNLGVSNKALSNKGELVVANKTLKNKGKPIVTNKKPTNKNKLRVANKALNKSKLEVGKKKLNNNAKKGLANRKLGTLLIEVNRYSSLRKFAWRKYSNIKEKTYIVETGDEDVIPAIVDSELSYEQVKQNCDNKNDGDDKGIMERYGVKPCKLLLCKLEDIQWDSKEVPVKTESGTYAIKHSQAQDSEKPIGAPEIMKKRKKKSALQRHKKGTGRPKTAKKDIVDYYAAAIESLRKKALLLEEDEKKKAEKIDSESRLVIKQEVVESPEYNENEGTGMASPVNRGSDGKEDSLQCDYNDEKCSLTESNGLKTNDSLKEGSTHTDTDIELTNNDDSMSLEKDNELNVKSLAGPENINDPENEIINPKKLVNTSESKSGASSHCVVKSDCKFVKIAERNYEGEMIQIMIVTFQDQDDIEEISDNDVDSDLYINESIQQENVVADLSQGDYKDEAEVSAKQAHANKGLSVGKVMDIRESDIHMDSPEVVESTLPDYVGHCSKNIAPQSVKETDAQNGRIFTEFIKDIEQISGYNAENNATKASSASEACGSSMNIMECDDSNTNSCNKIEMDRKLPICNVEQENREKHESAPHVSSECNRNGLVELSTAPDCSFIHKDIVLGFEDELGTDTVFSKLAVGGDEDMFLLGDGDDDDAENIGLIPDEEVERLLGLDKKEGESENDLSTVKRNENKTLEEGADSNIDKLSWTMLPVENQIIVDESKNTISDPEKLEQRVRNKTEQLNALTIDIHPAGDISRSDVSPERPTPSTDNKSAEISPSWKRILGSKALKEIEESVSSSIATSSVKEVLKNQNKSSEKKFKSRLQADKLKLCTGVLSKALKLSAEMRKTFGDSISDVDQKNGNKTAACSVQLPAEIKNSKNDGGSFVNIANSVVSSNKSTDDHKDMYSLDDLTLGNADISIKDRDRDISMASIAHKNNEVTCHGDGTGGNEMSNKVSHAVAQEANEGSKRVVKTFGKNLIDLSKLKMKLTPILASARVKSAAADYGSRSVQEENKDKIGSSISLSAPEIKEQGQGTPVVETPHQNQQPVSVSGTTEVKKTVTPLLNTEKLTNILKNFKKPLKLNLTSKSTKTCSSLAGPSLTDVNTPDFKTQDVPNKKSPTRKRTRPSHHNIPIESKRSKLTVTEISSSSSSSRSHEREIAKDSEDEKAGRSCFDCLSEITPSD